MLATVQDLLNVPGMSLLAARPTAWTNSLLVAADYAVKTYLKRDMELTAYVQFYSGQNQEDLIIRQRPVWMAQTNLAAPSIGQSLPQGTITVLSTAGFHPGTAGNPNATPPTIGIATGISTVTTVTYTGTTPTTFTGCTGGTGTMQNNAQATNPFSVYSPVVWYDPTAARGQSPTAFGVGTQMVLGAQYMVVTDKEGTGSTQAILPQGCQVSNRGLIKRWAGGGYPIMGWWFPQNYFGDKLAGVRKPIWNIGDGCIKVAYTAGFVQPPPDLNYVTCQLVAQMVRIQPNGADMASENLGQYSYNVLQGDPEMGSMRQILSRWRERSWSSGS